MMLKTYKVILVCHQECANYRAFMDIPVVCTHNCSWSAVSARVTIYLVTVFPLCHPNLS
jgi:hypothetical protein